MASRFDPDFDRLGPDATTPVDSDKQYDIYCAERGQQVVVYRNAKFIGMCSLFPRHKRDLFSAFLELEQSNGQPVYVQRNSVIKFCEPGTELTSELVSS